MEINDELFLFDRVWFPKVFRIARESGLDWIRMCAAAEVLSDGDPRARNIDWNFINESIGSDSPVFGAMYDQEGQPSADIIDRGTQWGLFQIVGQRAIDFGHTGRLVNLIDITKNTQVACSIMVELINRFGETADPSEHPQRVAEKSLGWPIDKIDQKVSELKAQMEGLMVFGD